MKALFYMATRLVLVRSILELSTAFPGILLL